MQLPPSQQVLDPPVPCLRFLDTLFIANNYDASGYYINWSYIIVKLKSAPLINPKNPLNPFL